MPPASLVRVAPALVTFKHSSHAGQRLQVDARRGTE